MAIKGGVAFMNNSVNSNINTAIFVDSPSIVRMFCRSMQQGHSTRFQQAIRLGNVFPNVDGDEQIAHEILEAEILEAEIAELGDCVYLSLPGGTVAANVHFKFHPSVHRHTTKLGSENENGLPLNFPGGGGCSACRRAWKPYTIPKDFGGYQVDITSQATGETLMLTVDALWDSTKV
ncbi:hypothetical protein PEBR_32882 [Penicillium brasilianum]|uniref:Uncharacterized protein n=1 Tax=Penicillium brasilianum TaxID=104259 RepID=A0A1S9REX5_PENBI|nr:hypothetical protein PEBR_32882 [Penicillium brasilianum]